MSLFDWLTGKIECPRCGTGGAKEVNGQVQCKNPTCAYFKGSGQFTQVAAYGPINESFQAPAPAGFVTIRYTDFRGKARTFIADAASARRRRNHIGVKVDSRKQTTVVGRNPQTGEPLKVSKSARLVLSRDRILNLSEVEAAFPQPVAPGQEWPTPRERQVLNYHIKHHSSSPLYESIRAKYPNW